MTAPPTTTRPAAPTGTATAQTGTATAKVRTVLHTHPGATVAEIATAAGVGNSTASRILTTLETDGHAHRTPGGRHNGRRTPDTWHPTTTEDATAHTTEPAPADTPEADTADDRDTADDAGTEDSGTPTAVNSGTTPPEEETADTTASSSGNDTAEEREPGEEGGTSTAPSAADTASADTASETDAADKLTREPDTHAAHDHQTDAHSGVPSEAGDGLSTSATPEATAPDTPSPGDPIPDPTPTQAEESRAASAPETSASNGPVPRARKGQLREKVAAYLADHPNKQFGPHEIGRALGHSSGAVAVALDALVRLHGAKQTWEHPARYAHPDAEVTPGPPSPRPVRGRRPRPRTSPAAVPAAVRTAAQVAARARDAAAERTRLNAAHPTQPEWGRYAQQAADHLARLLGVTTADLTLGGEVRTPDTVWVRLTLTPHPQPTSPTPATPAPTTTATATATTATGTGTGTGVHPDPTAADTDAIAIAVTAPFPYPERLLALAPCHHCGQPVPSVLLRDLADLGDLLLHGPTPPNAPTHTTVPELTGHPTHHPTCPEAATP